jgi:hypothetical protein
MTSTIAFLPMLIEPYIVQSLISISAFLECHDSGPSYDMTLAVICTMILIGYSFMELDAWPMPLCATVYAIGRCLHKLLEKSFYCYSAFDVSFIGCYYLGETMHQLNMKDSAEDHHIVV